MTRTSKLDNPHKIKQKIREVFRFQIVPHTQVWNIAKGTTDPRVEFCLPKKQVLTQILIKFQNSKSFDQTLTSKSWPNIHFITSPSLSSKILTKLQFQNFAWTSTSNSWPNLVLNVWTKFSFMTKFLLPNLHTTVVKPFLIINISNSNNLNKF